jgi:cell wall-associated NlpC family hydrolase
MGRHCSCNEPANETDELSFGEDGELIPAPGSPVLVRPPFYGPCPIGDLNGSWLLEVVPSTIFSPLVRGPMRIEVGPSSLRASGDIYSVRRFFPWRIELIPPVIQPTPKPTPIPTPIPDAGDQSSATAADASGDFVVFPTTPPWYPSFPKSQYSWYFRSNGVTYANGVLTIQIVRHLWNATTQDFVSTDQGTLTLTCRQNLIAIPLNPLQMEGTLSIGGSVSTVKATKTSPFFRGCRVEVDAMVNRTFPAAAVTGSGATVTFQSVYAAAGWDVRVTTDQINIPDDASLTNAELQQLLTTHRQGSTGEDWRLWLLVGSTQGTLFGVMFDDDTVPREGAVGFADATLNNDPRIAPNAQNQALNNVPTAFMRTLVHEAGHAFNLFHPKHDVHQPAIGTEIMNQTGDVIGFASSTNTYPGNASFAFSQHDRTSLIHAPDPQVRPGWKNFGWGHGSLSAGLPAPVDVSGLATGDSADGLELGIRMPSQAFVGEFLTAEVTLTNTGDSPRQVTSLLTLAEGDLVFLRTTPGGEIDHVLDITVGCGPRPMVLLKPGESISNHVQVFFTNQGVTFTSPGRHTVVAQLEVDAVTTAVSAPATVDVRMATSEDELSISGKSLTKGVGKALALGDFASDEAARAVLTELAESYADTDTGAASALVMANSLARSFTDYRAERTRSAAPREAQRFLDLAIQGRSATRAVELAVAVASPTEKDAPVVANTLTRLRRGKPKPRARSAAANDLAAAERIAEDFAHPQAR